MSAPDVVYLCRSGENEELRYSLRSLKNVPHGQVWIFGGAPSWISDRVNFVGVPQTDFNFRDAWKTKFENTRRNLYTATQQPEVSEHFLLMNDDFYVTEVFE